MEIEDKEGRLSFDQPGKNRPIPAVDRLPGVVPFSRLGVLEQVVNPADHFQTEIETGGG